METRLKEEIEVEFIAESMKCCVLCPEVKESLKLLVNHFKDGNCEGKQKLIADNLSFVVIRGI